MELKQLRYFYDVLRLHSFTAAARENHVSQSAVSQKIKALESELGVELLDRQGREFSATQAGTKLYEYAEAILTTTDQAVADIRRTAAGKLLPQFTIGVLASSGLWEPEAATALFKQNHPDTKVITRYGTSEQLQRALLNGTVDVIVADAGSQFSDYFSTTTIMSRYNTVEIAQSVVSKLPSSSLMPAEEELSSESLSEIPCILLSNSGGYALADSESENSFDNLNDSPRDNAAQSGLKDATRNILSRGVNPLFDARTFVLPDGTKVFVRHPAPHNAPSNETAQHPTISARHEAQEAYLRNVLHLTCPTIEAENVRQAHVMVAAGKGFLLHETRKPIAPHGKLVRFVPLVDRDGPVRHTFMIMSMKGHHILAVNDYTDIIMQLFSDTTF